MENGINREDRFSTTEVGVLVEKLRSEIKPVLEAIPGFEVKLDRIYEQVGRNTEKIEMNRLLITRNQGLIDRVLEELKSKVDRTEFVALEKKVASLAH